MSLTCIAGKTSLYYPPTSLQGCIRSLLSFSCS